MCGCVFRCAYRDRRAGPKADASRLWRLARARNGQRLLLARQHESPSAAVKQQLLALTDEGLAFAEQALARNDQDANVHKWWVGCMYSRTWWW